MNSQIKERSIQFSFTENEAMLLAVILRSNPVSSLVGDIDKISVNENWQEVLGALLVKTSDAMLKELLTAVCCNNLETPGSNYE